MQKLGLFLLALTVLVTTQAPLAAARERARERGQALPLNDPRSLASPDYQGYRPAWANPYAEPPMPGVNDFPTPFNPADVDSGPGPLDRDSY